MAFCPFVPLDPAPTFGAINVTACVLHRTSNSSVNDDWGGAYAVGKAGTFHFLVGLHDGQVVQFGDTSLRMWHAYGANDWAFGVEFVGQNGTPLSAWQLKMGGDLIEWAAGAHGLPLSLYDGDRVRAWSGFLNHRNVDAADHPELAHYDYVSAQDWALMVATTPTEDDMTHMIREASGAVYANDGPGYPTLSPAAIAAYQAAGVKFIEVGDGFIAYLRAEQSKWLPGGGSVSVGSTAKVTGTLTIGP